MIRKLTLTALTLALAAAAVNAAPPPMKGPSHSGPVGKTYVKPVQHQQSFASYHVSYGQPYHGTIYRGYDHYHWGHVYVHPVYNCRFYWDPITLVDYYWCAPDRCYYPITYRPYGTYIFG